MLGLKLNKEQLFAEFNKLKDEYDRNYARCVGCAYCERCTNCEDCANCANCKFSFDCTNCINCINCANCINCEDCRNCILCYNLNYENADGVYWLLNKKVTCEEFAEASMEVFS